MYDLWPWSTLNHIVHPYLILMYTLPYIFSLIAIVSVVLFYKVRPQIFSLCMFRSCSATQKHCTLKKVKGRPWPSLNYRRSSVIAMFSTSSPISPTISDKNLFGKWSKYLSLSSDYTCVPQNKCIVSKCTRYSSNLSKAMEVYIWMTQILNIITEMFQKHMLSLERKKFRERYSSWFVVCFRISSVIKLRVCFNFCCFW